MANTRKKGLLIVSTWLLVSTLIALLDPTHVFIHRRDFDKVAAAFHQDPTPANEAVLRTEEQRNQSVRNEVRVVEAAGLFVAGILGYGIYATLRYALASRRSGNFTRPTS